MSIFIVKNITKKNLVSALQKTISLDRILRVDYSYHHGEN